MTSSIHGGKIADIPKPHRRMFDDRRRKRTVTSQITTHYGLGTHFYASLDEEENPIWDASPEDDYGFGPGWRSAWDDEGLKGRYFHRRWNTVKEAERWLARTYAEEFADGRHKLVCGMSDKPPKWFYKEGD